MKKLFLFFLLPVIFITGCSERSSSGLEGKYAGGCEQLDENHEECGQAYINCVAYAYLEDWYLWYEFLPDIEAHEFESLRDMLNAVRYREGDVVIDRFSYALSKEAHESFYAGKRYGMGASWKRDEERDLFVTFVYPESPADVAGLKRGQQILKINDFTIEELDENAAYNKEHAQDDDFEKKTDWSNVYDAENEGEPVELTLLEEGSEIVTTVYLGNYDMKSVLKTEVIDNNGKKTGYLHLKAFITPTEDELNEAFKHFKEKGVEELVLDMRYNGGGLVRGSAQLINLIAGSAVDGEKIIKILYNDKKSGHNKYYQGKSLENSLDLKKVAIITTRGTASASEMVINSLDPFVEVSVIGDTTSGKPVGMNSIDICDQTMVPITFKNANSLGYGDYFFGIEATCRSFDDFKHDFGDTREDSLKEALYYLANGKCSESSQEITIISSPIETLIPFKLEGVDKIDYTF